MAEKKEESQSVKVVEQPRSASAREVFAARMQSVENNRKMTPKLRRQLDRMMANLQKGNK